MTTEEEPLILDGDDDADDDDDEEEGPAGDEQPRASSPDVEQCPYCEHTTQGTLRAAWMGQHVKREHPDQADEFKASRPNARRSAESRQRVRARKNAGEPAPRTRATPRSRTDAQPRGAAASALRGVRDGVEMWYGMVAMFVGFRDPTCADAISQSAKPAAAAWMELAKTNEAVRKFWSGAGGDAAPWLGLAMAHTPILLTVRAHHIEPAMERRRVAREQAMMEFDDERPLDGQGETVVYTTDDAADLGDDHAAPFIVGLDLDGNAHVASADDGTSPFTEGVLGGA